VSDTDEWIGVDLDRTLAEYTLPKGLNVIGDPIPRMAARVRDWIEQGKDIRIMTARVSLSVYRPTQSDIYRTELAIADWTEKHFGVRLSATCIKNHGMIELWDDRAIQVHPNTGVRADGKE